MYLKGWTGLTIDPCSNVSLSGTEKDNDKKYDIEFSSHEVKSITRQEIAQLPGDEYILLMDADYPDDINTHAKYRPNDIHLTLAVTNYDGEIDMCFTASVGSWLGNNYVAGGAPLGDKYPIKKEKCLTVNTLISQYSQFAAADFFSLDVETNEDKVLECCDFKKFTPTLMIIENEMRGKDLRSNWIHFIDPYYDLVATVPGNLVFLRK